MRKLLIVIVVLAVVVTASYFVYTGVVKEELQYSQGTLI